LNLCRSCSLRFCYAGESSNYLKSLTKIWRRTIRKRNRVNPDGGNFVRLPTTVFASQLFRGIFSFRAAGLMGLIALYAAALPAQVSFLGAQQTVPATGLSGPNGAAMDSSGNLYIVDTGNNRLVKIAPTGTQTPVSVAPLTLSFPLAVTVDVAGNLYVTDNGNNRVVKIPAGGGNATAFASVVTPDGLAVDANGNVFVADNEDGSIIKVTSAGATSTFETDLSDPLDVAVDTAGNVYLADGLLNNIVKFPAAGGSGTNLGSSLFSISGVAVDRAGNVYVAESGEGALIVEITPSGTQTTLATSGLFAVTYFAVDSNYDLFIPDNINNNVIEFSTVSVPMGFANVCQGGAPAPCSQTATLQFALGEISISSINVVTSGDSGLDFSQSGGTCEGETSPCTVQITFQPTQPGMRSGAVALFDSCLGVNLAVPVYGTGNGADAGFNPALTSPPFGTDGFQDPIAVAVAGDGIFENGPIFIADDEACVIWIAGDSEDFEIYAGTYGTCGFAGDGSGAMTAQLGHPGDVALDGAGNLYIADTANNVVRKVDRNGNISTVAGNNGLGAGFSGDGGAATSAALNAPAGVALDSAGNLYIADENNSRIRKVDLAGIITTVAGSNQSGYSGDGGPATSAKLHRPLGVRADTAGNLFIGDSFNNVVRKVDLTGTITTVAGNFAAGAGYSGDGGPATSAQLNFPVFVSVDAAGQLFITDANNNVIRRVDRAGKITTFVVPTDSPSDFVIDPTGNVAIIDPVDEALTLIVRTIPLGLSFASQGVNITSTPQDVIVTDIGNEPLNFSSISVPIGFNLSGPDTSCSTDSAVNLGLDCILGVVFDPATGGDYEDAVVLTDNSLGPAATSMQPVQVSGTAVAPLTSTTTALTASPNPAASGQTVTLTATVTPTPTGGTLGSVDFCLGGAGPDVARGVRRTRVGSLRQWKTRAVATPEETSCGSGTLLGTVGVMAGGTATFTVTNLATGANVITTIYDGNDTLAASTSDPVTVTITTAANTTTTLAISPTPGVAGQAVTLTGTVSPVPAGSPLGTVTFCDAGSEDSVIRRSTNGRFGATHRETSTARPAGQPSPCGGDALLGSITVTTQGTAVFSTTMLAAGDHNIYAVYSGNSGSVGSTSDTVLETVNTAYTVTAPQTPFNVAEGGSVQITVTVPPLGGAFNSVVTLSASGLPPRATATFNPPMVTPGTLGATTVMTVQLATATAQQPTPVHFRPSRPIPLTPVVGSMLALLIMALTMTGAVRKPQPRLVRIVLLAGAVSTAALALNACNGGFAGLTTPTGQYTITVLGTSGSLHPSTTVTVVVQ
jgi:sugar lactone lactonase YvrE